MRYCPNAKMILVGTKTDLRCTNEDPDMKMKQVTYEEGVRMAAEIGAEKYVECSAKTQDGVKAVFEEAVKAVVREKKTDKKKGCQLL